MAQRARDTRAPQPAAPGRTRTRKGVDAVRVRMYRHGLGDCFLLSFPREPQAFHVLVDCGVLLGTENADAKMTEVARDIRATTGDRLDVVVATHQHWDHVSGFLQAQREFDALRIGEVWFAWTEDPDDSLAQRLQRDRASRIRGLRTALGLLEREAGEQLPGLRGVLGFHGPAAVAARGDDTSAAFGWLKEKPGAQVRYLRPGGQVLPLEGVEGVRVYVLGPPGDERLLRRSRPSASSDVYRFATAARLEDAFLAALPRPLPTNQWARERRRKERERSLPFEEQIRLEPRTARSQRFFRDHYGFGRGGPLAWRRIDRDWLRVAEELALNLDSDTNNTSLVLAIELVRSGRVILLAADAQIGNWESWSRYRWRVTGAEGAPRTVTSADLLHRTVLYKVGHHGSHNATLRETGLEQMDDPGLVAMLPVNAGMAKTRRWNMPFPKLLSRLEEKTLGRVLRADEPIPEPTEENAAAWREFSSRVRGTRLYVECDVPL